MVRWRARELTTRLPCLGVFDSVDELGEFITHRFADDAGSGSPEVYVGCAASANIECVGK
jgi:hypothetical protein